MGGIDIRLQFDLVALEGKSDRHILYNFRNAEIEAEVARITLEIAHWVLQRSGVTVPIRTLEYVDISAPKRISTNTRRKTTVNRMKQNGKIIKTLWPTI